MANILNDKAEILGGAEELLLKIDETTETESTAESTEDVQQPEAVATDEVRSLGGVGMNALSEASNPLAVGAVSSSLDLAPYTPHAATMGLGEKAEAGNTVLPQTKTAVTNKKHWSRRLVIVTGDKGGVGKSTFARGLAQTYLDMKKEFLAFDADISNSHLSRFYGDKCLVRELDFFTEGNVDIFLDDLKELIEDSLDTEGAVIRGKSLFLLELPPQSMRILKDVVQQMKFLSTVDELYDMRVTIVVVISRVMDSVKQLITLYDFCQDQVDYVVVKNLFFGSPENFVRYKESSDITAMKDILIESNIPFLEITMPDLIEHAYDYLDKNSLTFNQGIEQKEKPSVKGRVSTWISKFKEQVWLAKSILGLENVPRL